MIKKLIAKIPWTAVKEGGKEALRIVVIAVLPVFYAGLNVDTGEVNLNWKLILVVAVVAILKLIDKTIHEVGKTLDNESLIKGLTRF